MDSVVSIDGVFFLPTSTRVCNIPATVPRITSPHRVRGAYVLFNEKLLGSAMQALEQDAVAESVMHEALEKEEAIGVAVEINAPEKFSLLYMSSVQMLNSARLTVSGSTMAIVYCLGS